MILLLTLITSINGVTQCEDVVVEIIGVNPNCTDFCDGAVLVDVIMAEFPVAVSILNSEGLELYAGPGTEEYTLCPGWYFVNVIDNAGCEVVDSVELINHDPITFDYTVIPPSAPGLCDGYGEVDTVYGWQGDYAAISISWVPDGPVGIAAWVFEDMCANAYTLAVGDEWGCTGVQTFSIGSLASLPSISEPAVTLFVQQGGYYLSIDIVHEPFVYKCFDLRGALVDTFILNTGYNLIRNQTNGCYIYQVCDHAGRILTTGKIVF